MSIVHITPSTHKMGAIPSVSMLPAYACPPHVPCLRQCYANRLCGARPTMAKRWLENYKVAVAAPELYFGEIALWLADHTPKRFRWHVGGDILDAVYYRRMNDLAYQFPHTQFICFTKRYAIVADYAKASNLTVIASCWPGIPLPDNLLLPRAYVSIDTRVPTDAYRCKGNCESCLYCFGLSSGSVALRYH